VHWHVDSILTIHAQVLFWHVGSAAMQRNLMATLPRQCSVSAGGARRRAANHHPGLFNHVLSRLIRCGGISFVSLFFLVSYFLNALFSSLKM
jgi:hypothetical protein